MKACKITSLGCLTLLGVSVMRTPPLAAQTLSEYKQPGDSVRLQLVFDGPDKDRIESVSIRFLAPSIPPEEAGLNNQFVIRGTKIKPGEFLIVGTIPSYAASGEYRPTVSAGPSDSILKDIPLPEQSSRLRISVKNNFHFNVNVKELKQLPGKD